MLLAAFAALTLAVMLGMVLLVLQVRGDGGREQARIGMVHGSLAAIGVAVLLLGLRHATLRALSWDAVALLVGALLIGATWFVLVRRGRPPGAILALHAALGFIGYVLLAAFAGSG